jgi:hypothetical protein
MRIAMLLLALAPLPLQAADWSGTWVVDGSIADHPVNPTCTLKQTEKAVSGSCKVDADYTAAVTGSVAGDEVTWKYDQPYEGTTYTLTYVGKLDAGTTMKGTIAADPSDSQGEFTAQKQ